MATIFISYAREDYESAKRLHDHLKAEGHDPWLDRERLLPGQRWQPAIEVAIRQAHFFVAILSPNSVEKRGYVQKELRTGMEMLDHIPDSQVFLIPARVAECEPNHERLRELHWVDFFPNWDEGLQRLMKVFNFAPPEALVPDLSGTSWYVVDSDGERYTIHLAADRTVSMKADTGDNDGTWRQSGQIFYMEFNGQYSQYRGSFGHGVLSGEAQNVAGQEWTWRAVPLDFRDQILQDRLI